MHHPTLPALPALAELDPHEIFGNMGCQLMVTIPQGIPHTSKMLNGTTSYLRRRDNPHEGDNLKDFPRVLEPIKFSALGPCLSKSGPMFSLITFFWTTPWISNHFLQLSSTHTLAGDETLDMQSLDGKCISKQHFNRSLYKDNIKPH